MSSWTGTITGSLVGSVVGGYSYGPYGAVAGGILGAVTGYYGTDVPQEEAEEQRKIQQEKSQRRIELQKRQTELQQRKEQLKLRRQAVMTQREERVKRARLLQAGEVLGISGSTGVTAASGSLAAQSAEQIGFVGQMRGFGQEGVRLISETGSAISDLNRQLASSYNRESKARQYGQIASSLSQYSGQIGSYSGNYLESLFSPTYGTGSTVSGQGTVGKFSQSSYIPKS